MFNGLAPSSKFKESSMALRPVQSIKFKVPGGWLKVQRPPVSSKIKDLEP